MILEVVEFAITTDRLAEFEAAYAEARKIIRRAAGCGTVNLHRCLEVTGRYLLFVEWLSVQHHMEGFRGSPDYQEWRRIISPFFAAPPRVEHYVHVPPGNES